jgi:hypothetical protein
MKTIFYLQLLLVTLLIAGCQKESMVTEQELRDEYAVTPDEAENIAAKFLNKTLGVTKSAFSNSMKVVKDNFSLKDSASRIYLHAINYQDGGFILIAGDN